MNDSELEAMEHKIEIAEYHASLSNSTENRAEIHRCYRSALAKSKHRFADGEVELANMWLETADIIESIAMRLNPAFKIKHKKK